MSWFSDLITGGAGNAISGTLNGVGDIAIKLRSAITGDITPEAKAELQKHLADLDTQLNLAQAKINEVEAGSATFFVAGARPALMWVCVLGMSYTFILQPFLIWGSLNFHWISPPNVDSPSLTTLVISMLGLAGLRSLDKIQGVQNNH